MAYSQLEQEIQIVYRQIQEVVQSPDNITAQEPSADHGLRRIPRPGKSPFLRLFDASKKNVLKRKRIRCKTNCSPGSMVQYMFQKIDGVSGFFGYQAGIQIPLCLDPPGQGCNPPAFPSTNHKNKINDLGIPLGNQP